LRIFRKLSLARVGNKTDYANAFPWSARRPRTNLGILQTR
jgi:hypothetical protein